MTRSLSQIERKPVEALVAGMRSDNERDSKDAGWKLINQAKDYGVGLKDYLTLAVDVRASDHSERYSDGHGGFVSGYDAALRYLNIPLKDDYENGVTLNLAADTFQTYPGTRAMFPEVINDMVQWRYRQDNLERIDLFVAQTRTISGVEEITTIVDDEQSDYKHWVPVAEGARIPVKTIRTTQQSVKFYKFGHGIRSTYEFNRRARLDLLVPFLSRTQREIEMSKVGLVTNYLINGDSVAANAATVTNQSSYNANVGSNSTDGKLSFDHFMYWLVKQYEKGIYIDTIAGNIETYFAILKMFTVPSSDKVRTLNEDASAMGFSLGGIPILGGQLNFALSSTVPAKKIVGFSKAETVEQLYEAGSLINESERSIENQTVTAYATENAGFKIIYPDTREVFDFNA